MKPLDVPSTKAPLHHELWRNVTDVGRVVPFTAIAVGTFTLDLVALYVGITILGYPYYWVVIPAFFFFEAINYVLARIYVFPETRREWTHGLLNFIAISVVSAIITLSIVAFFVEMLGMHYMMARVISGCTVGIIGYLVNLHLNFRLGWHEAAHHHQ